MTIHGNSHGKKNDKYNVLYVLVIVIFKYFPKILNLSVSFSS
jgi:hypothetical protein